MEAMTVALTKPLPQASEGEVRASRRDFVSQGDDPGSVGFSYT